MLNYLKLKSVDEISKQQADTLIDAKRKQLEKKGVICQNWTNSLKNGNQ